MTFRVICSWCDRLLCEGDPGAPTSHTACEECARRLLDDYRKGRAA